mgnify:CR=1 FL=1
MARIRSIKIGFFQNDTLSLMPASTRLLFCGLWVLADREGRLEDRPGRIWAELFPYEPQLLHEMEGHMAALAGAVTPSERRSLSRSQTGTDTRFPSEAKRHLRYRNRAES